MDEAATPIRVAADGVQLIYWAPLAPLIVPIIFLTRAKDHRRIASMGKATAPPR